jgi:hypothetical protein
VGRRYEVTLSRAISEIDFGLIVDQMVREPWCSDSQLTVVMYHSGSSHKSATYDDGLLIVDTHMIVFSLFNHETPRHKEVLAAVAAAMRVAGIDEPIEEE